MSVAWVAGSTRARAMTQRRLGRVAARELAGCPSLAAAVTRLVDSPYGHDVRDGDGLAEVQRAVVATTVWNLRVLAGWQPREGVVMLRALLAAVEAANVADRLRDLAGGSSPAPWRLGGLATAGARLEATASRRDLRAVLRVSPWGDPGTDSPREISLTMRLALADRIRSEVPPAGAWASGAVALALAREVLTGLPVLPEQARRVASRVVGPAAAGATSLPELARALPADARWALAGVHEAAHLWRAEARWWARVDADGLALHRDHRPGPAVLVGCVALLAVDAWRVRAAVELAARGGGRPEALDAVA